MSAEPTDTTEKGLEDLIVRSMTRPVPESVTDFGEPTALYGAGGWLLGHWRDYDREYCVDLAQLAAFLEDTQPVAAEALDLSSDSPTRRKFLARLQGEISKRGTIDVLRHGIKHGPHHIDVFFGTPSKDNARARERFASNRFSVTRQLRYSRDETQLALDLVLFINGIERAIQYYAAIREYLIERKSPHRAIVAFSGEHEYGGAKVTEASLNGFPSSKIAEQIRKDPHRFLICAAPEFPTRELREFCGSRLHIVVYR